MRTRVAAAAAAVLLTACGGTDDPAAVPSATDTATQEPSPTEPSSAVPPPTTAPAGVVTTIPDGIPLGIDLWDARGDGGEYHAKPYHPGASAPGRTLEACGQLLWPVMDGDGQAFVDQLSAWATGRVRRQA